MSSNGFSAGWEVEWRKLIASPVTRAATTLVAVGIVVLAVSMAVAAGSGNEMVLSQLGPLADAEGWELLVGASIQIGATAGLLGFGVSLSWMVGREFADGTIHGLFAIPVSRETLAAAKLAVYLTWTAIVAVMLVTLLLVAGLSWVSAPPTRPPSEASGVSSPSSCCQAGWQYRRPGQPPSVEGCWQASPPRSWS